MTIFSDIMKNHCGQLPVVYRGGRISVSQRGRIKIVIERFRAMTTDTELKQITAEGDDVPAVLLLDITESEGEGGCGAGAQQDAPSRPPYTDLATLAKQMRV